MDTFLAVYLFGSGLLRWRFSIFFNWFIPAKNKVYPKPKIEILSAVHIGIEVLIFYQVDRRTQQVFANEINLYREEIEGKTSAKIIGNAIVKGIA